MAELDIISLDEGQAATQALSANNAGNLEAMISGLSAWCDKLCGPFVIREVVEVVSGPYSGPVLLTSTPVAEVVSVVEHVGSTDTTIDEDDYQLAASGHYVRLFRRSGGYDSTWTAGNRNLTVTVGSGRYPSTAEVGYDVKERFTSLLREKWQYEAATWQRNRGEFTTDDLGNPVGFDAEARIRQLFASELLPPGIA